MNDEGFVLPFVSMTTLARWVRSGVPNVDVRPDLHSRRTGRNNLQALTWMTVSDGSAIT